MIGTDIDIELFIECLEHEIVSNSDLSTSSVLFLQESEVNWCVDIVISNCRWGEGEEVTGL